MPSAPRRRLRVVRLWSIRLHRWTGFALMAWFVFEAASGSYLAVADDLDPVLHHAWYQQHDRNQDRAGDVGVSAAAGAAAATVRGGIAETISYPVESHGVYEITVKDPDNDLTTAYVDPTTGTVNGTEDTDGGFEDLVLSLHADFNTASILGIGTRQVVGWLGIAWLLNLLLGLYVLRRRRRALRPRWAFKRGRTRRALHLAVHNWVGLVTLVPALIAVVTGIAIEFPAQADPLITAALPGRSDATVGSEPYSTPSGSGKRVDVGSVEQAVREADVGPIELIDVPVGNPAGVFEVIVDGGGYSPLTGGGRDVTVYVDQYSATPLGIDDPVTRSRAEKVADDWVYGLHFGFFGGLATRLLWLAIGLGTAVLALTALYIRAGRYPWQRRPLHHRERRDGLDSAQLELNPEPNPEPNPVLTTREDHPT